MVVLFLCQPTRPYSLFVVIILINRPLPSHNFIIIGPSSSRSPWLLSSPPTSSLIMLLFFLLLYSSIFNITSDVGMILSVPYHPCGAASVRPDEYGALVRRRASLDSRFAVVINPNEFSVLVTPEYSQDQYHAQ